MLMLAVPKVVMDHNAEIRSIRNVDRLKKFWFTSFKTASVLLSSAHSPWRPSGRNQAQRGPLETVQIA
jgi:hypothetical protein